MLLIIALMLSYDTLNCPNPYLVGCRFWLARLRRSPRGTCKGGGRLTYLIRMALAKTISG